MAYQGRFEGTAARKLRLVNPTYPAKRNVKEQRIINRKKKLFKAAVKALGKRILLGVGLLLAYASLFGMMLGLMLLVVQPNSAWTYLICGFSMGYAFLVLNCRAFEYIGDRMGSKGKW